MRAECDWDSLLEYNRETGYFVWLPRPENRMVSWNAKYAGKRAGVIDRPNGYIKIRGKYAHRLAWLFVHGRYPSGDVDHINGNKSDNRIENLRSVDRKTNMRNAKLSKSNKSGITGVRWHRAARKWEARIMVDGVSIHLGLYPEFQDAVCARKTAEAAHGFHKNHGRRTPKLQRASHEEQ